MLAISVYALDSSPSQQNNDVSIGKDSGLQQQWSQYVEHVMLEVKQQETLKQSETAHSEQHEVRFSDVHFATLTEFLH